MDPESELVAAHGVTKRFGELTAVVTRTSACELHLATGSTVWASTKATEVRVQPA